MKFNQILVRADEYYVLICGGVVLAVVTYVLSEMAIDRLKSHWRVQALVHSVRGPLDNASIYTVPRSTSGKLDYSNLPKGRWLKIHQQRLDDVVSFDRQVHSGSAWDSKRHRMIIFGSDTHGQNWDNSLYFFDLYQLRWQRAYTPDPQESYRVDGLGLPMAGDETVTRPWAMHTFDAIGYLPVDDMLIVASFPKHLTPGRFGNWLKDIWGKVKTHPTWLYEFGHLRWRAIKGNAVHFFPYATAYDKDRNLFVGFRPNGIYEFQSDLQKWRKTGKKSVNAYHTQAVYDNKNKAFIIFGSHNHYNIVHVYKAGEKQSREMATAGLRPPGTQHMPFAFNSKLGKAIAVIDTCDQENELAQTWTYDLVSDKWEHVLTADFPFHLGMNYHMQYSDEDDLLVLCASAPSERPSVWVLRL
jgi:hypothetical protein